MATIWYSRLVILGASIFLAGLSSAAEPSISGHWSLQLDGRSVPDAVLTPAAVKATRKHRYEDAEGLRWCRFAGMPQQMEAVLDIQSDQREVVVDTSAHAIARHLYIDGRKHVPADDFEATTVGHSIAHWEGDTLVVDTIGFSDRGLVGIPGGGFRTNNSHLVERYRLEGRGNILSVTFTWTDPGVFARPHSYSFRYQRANPGDNVPEPYCEPYDDERARFFEPLMKSLK